MKISHLKVLQSISISPLHGKYENVPMLLLSFLLLFQHAGLEHCFPEVSWGPSSLGTTVQAKYNYIQENDFT